MKLDWQNKDKVEPLIHDRTLSTLLFHEGSLTRYLQAQCKGKFDVEIQSESWQQPMPDEAELLAMQVGQQAFIRESWLKSDEHRLIYARSIIPPDTHEKIAGQLTELGTRPLGELLFKDESGYRSTMQYARIPADCDLFKVVSMYKEDGEDLWGRQSLFYIQDMPLLIIEIFLPTINLCLQQ